MDWLALDIGGANLKMADGKGYAESRGFALWQAPGKLTQELRTAIAESPESDHLAATMTGELADCFQTKAEGVKFILQALIQAADRRHTRVYLTDGKMVTPQLAVEKPRLAAASNWHALAQFAVRYAKQEIGLLLDIGSTTCDIIPLMNGQPAAAGQDDTQRLIHGELVYTGVQRSPVCSVARAVSYRGKQCPLAQELFATMRDVYLLLGELAPLESDHHTADGRPATKQGALGRLARAICADREMFDENDALAMAEILFRAQVEQIAGALEQVITRLPMPPTAVILSGQGEFLARRVIEAVDFAGQVVSLSEKLGPEISRCAPAHALAVLAREAAGL